MGRSRTITYSYSIRGYSWKIDSKVKTSILLLLVFLLPPPIFITRQSIYFAWVDAYTKEIARHNRSSEILGQIQECLKQPHTLLPFENVKYYVIRDIRFRIFPLPSNPPSVAELRSLIFFLFSRRTAVSYNTI